MYEISIIFLLITKILKTNQIFQNLEITQIPNENELISLIKESNSKFVFFTLTSLGIIDFSTSNSDNYEIKTTSLSFLNSTDVTLFTSGKYLAACTQNNFLEIISEEGNILKYIPYNDPNIDLTTTNLKCTIAYKNNLLLIGHSTIDDSSILYFNLFSYNLIDENTITLINKSTMRQTIGLLRTNYPYYLICYITSIPCCFFKSSRVNLGFIKLNSNYELIDGEAIRVDPNVYDYKDFKINYIGNDIFITHLFNSTNLLNCSIINTNPNIIVEHGYIVKRNPPDYVTWNGISYSGNPNFILGIYFNITNNQISFESLNLNQDDKEYESDGIIYYHNDIGCSQIYSTYIGDGKFFIILRGSVVSTTLEYFIYSIPEKHCSSNIIKAYSQEKTRYDGSIIFTSFQNDEEIFIYNTTYSSVSISEKKYIIFDNNEDYGSYTFSIGLKKEIDTNHIFTLYEDCLITYYICNEKCAYCDSINFEINGIYSNCSSKRCKSSYYYDPEDETKCLLKTPLQNRCYSTCNTCSDSGSNSIQNCLSCKYNYVLEGTINTNCITCNHGSNLWYYDATMNTDSCIILTSTSCPTNYNYIIESLNQCVKNCPSTYKYIYNNKCYSSCPSGTSKDTVTNTNNCCLNGYDYFIEGDICCLKGSKYFIEGNRCCDKGTYYNVSGNICCPDNYIWDSNGICCPNGYHADSVTLNCCPIGQSYNRKDNFCCPLGSSYNEISEKCECDYYYYFDNNNKQICLTRNECYNKNYPYLIENSRVCVSICDDEHKYIVNNTFTCIENCPFYMYQVINSYLCSENCKGMYFPNGMICECGHYFKKINNYKVYCVEKVNTSEIIQNSKNGDELIDNVESYLDQYLDSGEVINSKNISIKVINSSNEDIDVNAGTNLSSIYLGECENILKKHYNLGKNDPLIILQVDISTSNIANKVEYKVYDQNYNNLDLSLCDSSSISIYYSTGDNANIDLVESLNSQGLNIFDKSSDFYNSRCVSYSQDGNDVTIKDRKNDIYNNVSVCESGCSYVGYNNETKRVKCDCDVKVEATTQEEVEKKQASNFFESFNNQINYKLIICYVVFKKFLSEFYFNFGFWFYFFCMIAFIICDFHYIITGRKILYSKIKSAFTPPINNDDLNPFPSSPPQKSNLKKTNNNEDKKNNNNNNKNNNYINNNNKNNLSRINSSAFLNSDIFNNNNVKKPEVNNLDKLLLKNNSIQSLPKRNNSLLTEKLKRLNERKNTNVSIFLSNLDQKTNMKEYNITVAPLVDSEYINNEYENVKDPKIFRNSKTILFDKKFKLNKKKKSSNKKDVNNVFSADLHISNLASINSRYKRYDDKDSIMAIKDNKPETSFLKISTTRRTEYDNFISDANFKEEDYHLRQIKIYSKYMKVYLKKDEQHHFYEMTYLQALQYDKRGLINTFLGIFFIKVELINTLFFPEPFNIYSITISVYILSLLIDFTFNALMYTDDVVSQKYSNEGKLAFYTSFILSSLSNIITYIIMKFVKTFTNYSFAFEQIGMEIKDEILYYMLIKSILGIVQIRIYIYFFIELIIANICGYYIYIFCNIYKKSQFSMILNYLIGLGESLLISLGITIIVTILRIIALKSKSKRTYYSSRYLSELI